VGLERMLRMYSVQQWFNLADAACEDAHTVLRHGAREVWQEPSHYAAVRSLPPLVR
jgi:hypothetical protein